MTPSDPFDLENLRITDETREQMELIGTKARLLRSLRRRERFLQRELDSVHDLIELTDKHFSEHIGENS